MEQNSYDILSLAAIVSAYVGVIRGFGLKKKWTHLVALTCAAFFVLIPAEYEKKIITISIVGLSATGAYQYIKPKGE